MNDGRLQRSFFDVFAASVAALAIWTGLQVLDGFDTRSAHLATWILVAPVCEEIVFRGWLLPEVRRKVAWRVGQLTAANGLTTFAFVGIHVVVGTATPIAGLAIASMVFGWLRERSGRIRVPIATHIAANIVAITVLPRFI